MKELIESCKKAISESRCLGCIALEDENFEGNPNCKYSKIPTAQESIQQIKLNLRNGEKMKENSIKEDIEEVNKLLCQLKNELYAGTGISYWNANEVYAIALEHILADRERLQMENELMKNEFERLENLEDAIEELIVNKTIDISGFKCIAVDDLRDLIEELGWME